MPAREAAPQTAMMWREQVTLPPLDLQGAPVIRMSGGEDAERSRTTLRQ